MKRIIVKFSVFIALFIAACTIINSGSVFASVNPDFLNVDDIEIIEQHGIVEGSSCQLWFLLVQPQQIRREKL